MSLWFGRITYGRTAYLPPVSQHPQLKQKEGSSHCWLPSETNRGPSMPTRSNPWDLGEVCCLPGVWVRDITKKFPSLLWPSGYYLLLIFQVDSIKKALHNQEGPQGLGAIWLRGLEHILCSLLNCQWPFHIWHRIFCLRQVFNSHQEFKEMTCHTHIYSTGLFVPVSNKKENFCLWEQILLILCRWKLVKN